MKWLIPAAVLIGALVLAKRASAGQADPTYVDGGDVNLLDEAFAMGSNLVTNVMGSPVDSLYTSEAMKARLKQREGLRLNRYRLGDGGWTIGYGRFYPDSGTPPPERIDQDTAERWFAEDVTERGERWVKAYVSIPLTQNQFDALVSMAYNLKPSSFKTIAEEVNAGNDPTAAAMRYTRPGSNLERGLIARRDEELGIFFGTIEA